MPRLFISLSFNFSRSNGSHMPSVANEKIEMEVRIKKRMNRRRLCNSFI
jgi:transposase InsO family protein